MREYISSFFAQTKFWRINYAQLIHTFALHIPIKNFGNNHDSTPSQGSSVSMATSMEITFDHSFCVRSFLLVSQEGASSSEASPDLMVCWNWHTKLVPFFHFFFSLQLSNKQQSNIHCICKKYTSTSQKGPMWVFSGLGICPRRKVTWSKVSQVLRTRGSWFSCII